MLQDGRILDLLVIGEQQHFGDDFGRFRIVVSKRQEQSTAMLGMYGDDKQCPARVQVNVAAPQVDVVATPSPLNNYPLLF